MTAAARYGIVPAMLGTRILTALILIPLVLAALFLLPSFGWATAALAAIAVAAVEWARLAGSSQGNTLCSGARAYPHACPSAREDALRRLLEGCRRLAHPCGSPVRSGSRLMRESG